MEIFGWKDFLFFPLTWVQVFFFLQKIEGWGEGGGERERDGR